ncbi:MAG: DUF4433 domain-containing protein [Hahellaceae bacterium]|nr:DUF4433 domain-containing protein [Hahellaceae bacterium]
MKHSIVGGFSSELNWADSTLDSFSARLDAQIQQAYTKLEARKLRRAQAAKAKPSDQIQNIVDDRKIPYLVHFTPVVNLASILRLGILSRSGLQGISYCQPDQSFHPGSWERWISCSVSYPNYKMLYSKLMTMPASQTGGGWVILLLSPDLLWEQHCVFTATNSTVEGRELFSDPARYGTAQAFERLFAGEGWRIGIPESYTTDPQAEVLIHEEISTRYISGIVPGAGVDLAYLKRLTNMPIRSDLDLFNGRCDSTIWRGYRLDPHSLIRVSC